MIMENSSIGRNTMLKEYFSKFDQPKQKRNIAIVLPILFVLFILCGYAFFENLRTVCNILGSIVCASPWQAVDHLKRCAPILMLFFGVLYLLTYIYRLFFYDEERQAKLQKRGSIALMGFGAFGLLYLVIGLITGLYHIYEGYPTVLFPIDLLLLALVLIGLGVFFLLDKKVVKEFSVPGLLVKEKHNIAVSILKIACFIVSYFVACFSIYGLIMGGFIFDWRVYPIWGILFLVILLAYLAMFGYKHIVLPFVKFEVRGKLSFNISILMFIVGIVLVVLNTIAVFNFDNVACAVANGLLVISFTASFNAEYYIFGLGLLIPSIVMFIKNFQKKN